MNKISVWACDSKTQGTVFIVFWMSYLLLSQYIPTKYTYVSTRAYYALNPSFGLWAIHTDTCTKLLIHGT